MVILETLRLRKKERKQQREGGWSDLVRAVAEDDGKLNAEAVEQKLAELGRTAEELADAVELLRSREAWRELVQQRPAWQQRCNAVDQEIERMRAEEAAQIREIKERANAAVAALRSESTALVGKINAANHAANRLFDTLPQHIHDRTQPLMKQAEALATRRQELKEAISGHRNSDVMGRGHSRQRAQWQKELDAIELQLRELSQQVAAIEAEGM